MASGTKFRNLARLIDAADIPVWVIGPAGKIVYLSAGVGSWLGVEVESLLDRRCVAGTPLSDDPADAIAASLSPPPGLSQRGTASLKVQPPATGQKRIDPMEVRFVRIGRDGGLTIAIAGEFDDRDEDSDLHDAVAVRQRLDAWRKRHRQLATIATAGVSAAARRLRSRLQVAASTRCHVGFFGPTGSGAESIAARIHQLSAPGESLVTVDGPLMDAELLDATMMPAINQLADSDQGRATALVRGVDEMPIDAQLRLAELIATYAPRLRLLALCRQHPVVLREPPGDSADEPAELRLESTPQQGIHPRLVEVIATLSVTCQPLASRVEDIPLLAAAILDARHAAGEGNAHRISRGALDALVLYPWPENFEELDAAIRHAIRTAPSESVAVEHLPLAIRSYRVGEGAAATAIPLDEALRRYERRLISQAMEASDGNRAEAARRLGISRTRLLRRLDESEQE